MERKLLSAAAVLMATFAAGSASAEPLWRESGWSKVLGKSTLLVGRDLNGVSLNGELLDGRQVVGVLFEGATIDEEPLQAVELNATEFRGYDSDGRRVNPKRFAEATFEAELDDGEAITLYVVGRQRHPDKANRRVFGYEVWYETLVDYRPLCGVDAEDMPVLAIPMRGRWSLESGVAGGGAHFDDPTSFTFACEGDVIAKCVTGGYKPWVETLTCGDDGCEHGTLAEYHQACTRALRADYFGDGTSHTEDDTRISFFDGMGVRVDSEDWALEAEWDADGALCVHEPRLLGLDELVAPLFTGDCGDASYFESGTLLMTEAPPR